MTWKKTLQLKNISQNTLDWFSAVLVQFTIKTILSSIEMLDSGSMQMYRDSQKMQFIKSVRESKGHLCASAMSLTYYYHPNVFW